MVRLEEICCKKKVNGYPLTTAVLKLVLLPGCPNGLVGGKLWHSGNVCPGEGKALCKLFREHQYQFCSSL